MGSDRNLNNLYLFRTNTEVKNISSHKNYTVFCRQKIYQKLELQLEYWIELQGVCVLICCINMADIQINILYIENYCRNCPLHVRLVFIPTNTKTQTMASQRKQTPDTLIHCLKRLLVTQIS